MSALRPAIVKSLEKELDLFMGHPKNNYTFRVSDLFNLFENRHEVSAALRNLDEQGKVVKWTKSPVSYYHTSHQGTPRVPQYYQERQHKYRVVFDDEVKKLMQERKTEAPKPPSPLAIKIKILNFLDENRGRFNSVDVGKEMSIRPQHAMYHLKDLEEQGVLGSRKEGRRRVFWHVKHTEHLE